MPWLTTVPVGAASLAGTELEKLLRFFSMSVPEGTPPGALTFWVNGEKTVLQPHEIHPRMTLVECE